VNICRALLDWCYPCRNSGWFHPTKRDSQPLTYLKIEHWYVHYPSLKLKLRTWPHNSHSRNEQTRNIALNRLSISLHLGAKRERTTSNLPNRKFAVRTDESKPGWLDDFPQQWSLPRNIRSIWKEVIRPGICSITNYILRMEKKGRSLNTLERFNV
jgi:hypothetical protein